MTAKRSVATLVEALSKDMNNLFNITELKRVQQYAVEVNLDPETANDSLILSDDRKQVHYGDIHQIIPGNPKRLANVAVLGKQGFSSGKVYYEVQVEDRENWELGVVREPVIGNKCVTPTSKDGFWILSLSNSGAYRVSASGNIYLSTDPRKVGVFVGYEQGLVSFYDAESAGPIHSFTNCKFNVKVYPCLNPGYQSQTTPSPQSSVHLVQSM
ncbi:E3 ubiquitin-protein ligase TRIM21-like [Nothobranchius furzeri]|uniref:E3 ubiquitin-protein ligase TRIM21-like n=1 Tax=Nothobranchius furzeri TaxID=105023 RepID=A0A9D2YXQ8_NOTFU|nr:E3 ubiquitin-protein ligase TRIM21-like [Nothobranchius furzeri]